MIWNSRIPLRKVLVSHVKITKYCPKRILFLEGKNFCKFEEIHRPILICSHLLNSFLQKDLCLCRDFTEILLKKGTENSTKFKHFLKLANVQVYLDLFQSFMLNTAKKMSVTKFFRLCFPVCRAKNLQTRTLSTQWIISISGILVYLLSFYVFLSEKTFFGGTESRKVMLQEIIPTPKMCVPVHFALNF